MLLSFFLVLLSAHQCRSNLRGRNARERTFQSASITVDGDLSDWPLLYRTYPKTWEMPSLDPNFELFGMNDKASATYYFAIKRTDDGILGPATTIYLDTDQSSDSTTTHGTSASEYYIDFVALEGKTVPYLYAVNPWAFIGPVEYSFSADKKIAEMALPAEDIGSISSDVDFFVDVNDAKFFPAYFGSAWFVATHFDLPARPVDPTNKRVALVFSPESEERLFGGGEVNNYIYRQLYASFQYQLTMAGLPYDLIYVDELTDLNTILKYNALLFPYNAFVLENDHPIILNNLRLAVHHYGIGIVAGDNFMTNLSGQNPIPLAQPYKAMWEVLGLNIVGYGMGNFSLASTSSNHPVLSDYKDGETLLEYSGGFYNHYGRAALPGVFESSSTVTVLAETNTGAHRHNAVLAVDTVSGARHVHFGTMNMMADGNLLWKALQWTVYGNASPIGLKISREKSVFSARSDMDLAMFPVHVEDTIEPLLENYLLSWKHSYDFVGTYFITLGDGADGKYTDWSVSGPLYERYMEDGNEIGSHTYTHPYHISKLSIDELKFEFLTSGEIIEEHLELKNIGMAQSGNPESLNVVNALDQMGLYYFCGTYTGRGIGFPSAFGFLSPDATMGFLAPNMYSDFNLMSFRQLSSAEALQIWTDQFQQLTHRANTPIIHFHWHDYGPNEYGAEVFRETIELAYSAGSEFTTNKDLFGRLKQFKRHSLRVAEDDGAFTVTVSGGDSFGRLALDVSCRDSEVITAVENWYAYSNNNVFLPANGGTFTIRKGSGQGGDVTRITKLPMRAELLRASGDGTTLTFSFVGNGSVIVELNSNASEALEGLGATSTKMIGPTTMEMAFDSDEQVKEASIAFRTTKIETKSLVKESTGTCPEGRHLDLSGYCVMDWCKTNYVCPVNSFRKKYYRNELRRCFDSFSDCECKDGYKRNKAQKKCEKKNDCPKGRHLDLSGYCVKQWCTANYICPENSHRKKYFGKNLRKCFDTFADCECTDGYSRNDARERCEGGSSDSSDK